MNFPLHIYQYVSAQIMRVCAALYAMPSIFHGIAKKVTKMCHTYTSNFAELCGGQYDVSETFHVTYSVLVCKGRWLLTLPPYRMIDGLFNYSLLEPQVAVLLFRTQVLFELYESDLQWILPDINEMEKYLCTKSYRINMVASRHRPN